MTASSLSYWFGSSSLKLPPPWNLRYPLLFRLNGVSGSGVPGFFHLFDMMFLLIRIRSRAPLDAALPLLSLGAAIPPLPPPPMDSKSPVIPPDSTTPPDPRFFSPFCSFLFPSLVLGLDTEPPISAVAVSFTHGFSEFLKRFWVAPTSEFFAHRGRFCNTTWWICL